ncbi:hypothetical protein SAY86_017204 [Trapa natans]|uniref:Uncharacterized protein n=1 Tax=Trapa natans TaxID=22666 RepID=A0AAN7LPL8_TRANT|nr:hypothetical protein SAY86_017204 [Trapa natans]
MSELAPACPRNDQFKNAAFVNGIWTPDQDGVSDEQLEKFWKELSPQARKDLLKIDKQTLFEQARKNMYCSRCNGLLLEGFLQIVMYEKSFHEGAVAHTCYNASPTSSSVQDGGMCTNKGHGDAILDPSLLPWGGLTTSRDGSLTLLDCYIFTESLDELKTVFEGAVLREREREMLYPDACGGGARGWISQGTSSYGRGHGMREACALHTARLSCDTLVDFWSALGEETRQSLLRMKEEDFIERLIYRFDSKRFCRDCRRNVIREFKELKELKRMRREPRCTSFFCAADMAFEYSVSDNTIYVDWHQKFADSVASYHHFEWAVGTGEGKSDILEFENVGLNGSGLVTGLDLGGLNACFITVRAWKLDGRCTEFFVKAHALKGQPCLHGTLVVGDGFVTITRGENIRRFFEHAEEAEEEDDDDFIDKDSNELDGECSRPQKHAKSPELAREFLLDAATVIFKEQVEKAFREGTARQNAHSIFVCLALNLLQERVHIAFKEILTFEKQMKLLEEEEKDKHEEEKRKERKRMKERVKKLRRKERLKAKDKDGEQKPSQLEVTPLNDISYEDSVQSPGGEPNEVLSKSSVMGNGKSVSPRNLCLGIEDEDSLLGGNSTFELEDQFNESIKEDNDVNIGASSFTAGQLNFSHGKVKSRKGKVKQSIKLSDRSEFAVISENGCMGNHSVQRSRNENYENHSRDICVSNRQLKANSQKSPCQISAFKSNEKLYNGNNRMNERLNARHCGCNQRCDYRGSTDLPVSSIRPVRESKYMIKSESAVDVSKHFHRGGKYSQSDYSHQSDGRSKSKSLTSNNNHGNKDRVYFRKMWEPLESQKRCTRSNSTSDITLISSVFKVEEDSSQSTKSSCELCSSEDGGDFIEISNKNLNMRNPTNEIEGGCRYVPETGAIDPIEAASTVISSSSNSENCSPSLSEVDNNTPNMNREIPESSSTSDSEDASQQSERRKALGCNGVSGNQKVDIEVNEAMSINEAPVINQTCLGSSISAERNNSNLYSSIKHFQPMSDPNSTSLYSGLNNQSISKEMQHYQNLYWQMFQNPLNMGYYTHQSLVSWAPFSASGFYPYASSFLCPAPAPVGCGLDANQNFYAPYEGTQHLTPPAINRGPSPFPNPVCPPVIPVNGISSPKNHQPPVQTMSQGVSDAVISKERTGLSRVSKALEHPQHGGGKGDRPAKPFQEDSSFSLFHFGGPIALSSISKSLEGGEISDIGSVIPAETAELLQGCNEKETFIEEYNLFATSNSPRFSYF